MFSFVSLFAKISFKSIKLRTSGHNFDLFHLRPINRLGVKTCTDAFSFSLFMLSPSDIQISLLRPPHTNKIIVIKAAIKWAQRIVWYLLHIWPFSIILNDISSTRPYQSMAVLSTSAVSTDKIRRMGITFDGPRRR